MPPKPKFTKEEIVAAALEIVSKKGADGLTAQELKTALKSSASPIFTVFNSMKEIQEEVFREAMGRFEGYTEGFLSDAPVFKQIGMKMILFGINEPKLFQLLFMRENKKAQSFDDMFGELGETAAICIKAIEKDYGLSAKTAKLLFENMWIYTFGIGTLCATGACRFSKEEISEMLTREFTAMMLLLKSGGKV